MCVRALDGQGLHGLEECCEVRLTAGAAFLRGDCDSNQRVDITDAIHFLRYLFQGHEMPACFEVCNANDDDRLDIADAVFTIRYLFAGGPRPAEPSLACGLDADGGFNCSDSGCE